MQGKGKYKKKKPLQNITTHENGPKEGAMSKLPWQVPSNEWMLNKFPKRDVAKENGNLVSIKYQTKGKS
jgi:hypothetical protein